MVIVLGRNVEHLIETITIVKRECVKLSVLTAGVNMLQSRWVSDFADAVFDKWLKQLTLLNGTLCDIAQWMIPPSYFERRYSLEVGKVIRVKISYPSGIIVSLPSVTWPRTRLLIVRNGNKPRWCHLGVRLLSMRQFHSGQGDSPSRQKNAFWFALVVIMRTRVYFPASSEIILSQDVSWKMRLIKPTRPGGKSNIFQMVWMADIQHGVAHWWTSNQNPTTLDQGEEKIFLMKMIPIQEIVNYCYLDASNHYHSLRRFTRKTLQGIPPHKIHFWYCITDDGFHHEFWQLICTFSYKKKIAGNNSKKFAKSHVKWNKMFEIGQHMEFSASNEDLENYQDKVREWSQNWWTRRKSLINGTHCCKGLRKPVGINFHDFFAPLVRYSTFFYKLQFFIDLCTLHGWVQLMDYVMSASFNDKLVEKFV